MQSCMKVSLLYKKIITRLLQRHVAAAAFFLQDICRLLKEAAFHLSVKSYKHNGHPFSKCIISSKKCAVANATAHF